MASLTAISSSENETTSFESVSDAGVVTVTREITYTSPAFFELLRGARVGTNPDVEVGFDYTQGTGAFGASVEVSMNPSTGFTTVNASGTVFGVGFGGTFVLDENDNVVSSSAFGGGQIIIGAKGQVAGFAIGAAGTAKVGLFVDSDGINFGTDLNLSIGLFYEADFSERFDIQIYEFETEGCFAAGTLVTLADGSFKPIEKITTNDWVLAYDSTGELRPGLVVATKSIQVKLVLDMYGLRVTPGHVVLCGDGKFAGKHVPIIDILRSDGAVVKEDGTLIRAATNVPVGHPRDGFVQAITGTRNANGSVDPKGTGRIRLGTRFIVSEGQSHKSFSVYDLISAAGGVVGDDEMIRIDGGEPMPFHWEFGDTLPKPEDFVLACSGTSLKDIYKAAEWENHAPRLPTPVSLDGKPFRPLAGLNLREMTPNVTLKVKHVSASGEKS